MKNFLPILMGLLLLTTLPCARAADEATEERLNKLNGLVQDLLEDKGNTRKQLESLSKEIQALRDQRSSSPSSASAEELRHLAEKVQEIDRKREADKELILKEIEKLGKLIQKRPSNPPSRNESNPPSANTNEKGYEYVVKSGDTLSAIAAAYSEQGIKVKVDDILKANPGLKANSLVVDKKIFIPAPK
jgi:LysM repeat protein